MDMHSCLVCDSNNTSSYLHLKSNNLVVLKCLQCGHIFVGNSPINNNNISEFYDMDSFRGLRKLQKDTLYTNYYNDCFASYEDKLCSSAVLKQFLNKAEYFDLVFPQGGKLLDVGCATGVFLDMMKKRGWDVVGVEISEELASYARRRFSVEVYVVDLCKEKLSGKRFHVITLFDVIEHIPNPNLMINACWDLLYENGLLLIRTPTEEGLLRDIAKAIYFFTFKKIEGPLEWFYSFEHIHSFSSRTLNKLLQKHGFKMVDIFREEESLDRLNIPNYLKIMIKSTYGVSALLKKPHKVSIIAKKCLGRL